MRTLVGESPARTASDFLKYCGMWSSIEKRSYPGSIELLDERLAARTRCQANREGDKSNRLRRVLIDNKATGQVLDP